MRKITKNKKADIPVTILVIGIVAVCVLAIISFVISGSSNQTGVEAFEEIDSYVEKFYFYLNAGFSEEEALEKVSAEKISGKNLEMKIEENNLIIKKYYKERDVVLDIKYAKPLK